MLRTLTPIAQTGRHDLDETGPRGRRLPVAWPAGGSRPGRGGRLQIVGAQIARSRSGAGVLRHDERAAAPSLVPHVIPLLAWDPVADDAVLALRKVAEERVGRAHRRADRSEPGLRRSPPPGARVLGLRRRSGPPMA